MLPMGRDDRHIAFAEKVMTLLDEGGFTATYKFAVLLGLLDLCRERAGSDGAAPSSVTTRQLAEKVVELYWPQTTPYPGSSEEEVLLQLRSRANARAAVIKDLIHFREEILADPSLPLARVRIEFPQDFDRLVKSVEWTLIRHPLPRLQKFGGVKDRFIYEITWDERVLKGEVSAYQRGGQSSFDNTIRFKGEASEHLVLLSPLLRPLIEQKWTDLVSDFNNLPENALRSFMFGADRISLAPVRAGLVEIEGGRCFYCEHRFTDGGKSAPVVDHFIPWARHPNNTIENLVPAHDRCNLQKRDFLAAAQHVEKWTSRIATNSPTADQLRTLARKRTWETDQGRTLSVARAIYLRLRPEVRLWFLKQEFVPADRRLLQRALG